MYLNCALFYIYKYFFSLKAIRAFLFPPFNEIIKVAEIWYRLIVGLCEIKTGGTCTRIYTGSFQRNGKKWLSSNMFALGVYECFLFTWRECLGFSQPAVWKRIRKARKYYFRSLSKKVKIRRGKSPNSDSILALILLRNTVSVWFLFSGK